MFLLLMGPTNVSPAQKASLRDFEVNTSQPQQHGLIRLPLLLLGGYYWEVYNQIMEDRAPISLERIGSIEPYWGPVVPLIPTIPQ